MAEIQDVYIRFLTGPDLDGGSKRAKAIQILVDFLDQLPRRFGARNWKNLSPSKRFINKIH